MEPARCRWCRYYVPPAWYRGSLVSPWCCQPGEFSGLPAAGYCRHFEREPGADDDREPEGVA
jgi:hypothetical protein